MPAAIPRYRERKKLLGEPWKYGPSFPLGKFRRFSNGVKVEESNLFATGPLPSQEYERCWDEIHASEKKRGHSNVYRTGGPFCNIKVRVPVMETQGKGIHSTKGSPNFGPNSWWEYEGGFSNPLLAFDSIPLARYSDAGGPILASNPLVPSTADFESQAWKRIAPKIPRADLAVSLKEIGEIPRMMKQTAQHLHLAWKDLNPRYNAKKFMDPKRVADQFLNTQFGWFPFISDIQKLSEATIFGAQFIGDIIAANGSWMHRKAILEHKETSVRIHREYSFGCEPGGFQIQALCDSLMLDGISCFGYMDTHEDLVSHVWAEGCFKFYRPEFDRSLIGHDSAWSTVQRYMSLYGLRINPSFVYNITPWSWLVDYFSNLGDLVDRTTQEYFDGTVAKYLYVMHHQLRKVTSRHYFNFWSGPVTTEWTRYIESKQRKPTDSPYGFGVFGKDLSAKQWSILGALGLSNGLKR